MTRENRIKGLVESATMAGRGCGKSTQWILECASDIEKLEKIEALINDPVNRARGSVSIQAIREVLR